MRVLRSWCTVSARPARRAAFTLLEVVVALVLTSGLVLVSLRWVSTLGTLTSLHGEAHDPARTVAYAMSRLEADVAATGSCDPLRRDVAVAAIGPHLLALYVDDDGDGAVDLVTWRVEDGELRRRVNLADGSRCGFGADYTEVSFAAPLDVSAGATFVPVAAGARLPLPADVDCAAAGWAVCAWDAVAVRLVVDNGQDSLAGRSERVLRLHPDTRRS